MPKGESVDRGQIELVLNWFGTNPNRRQLFRRKIFEFCPNSNNPFESRSDH